MKIINKNNKILKVKPIENFEDVKLTEYKNNTYIIEIENELYFVIKRKFTNRILQRYK